MEDYERAADARLEDWNALNKAHRKVGTIHMGGIYIECLLKGMICMMYSVHEENPYGSKWNVNGVVRNRPAHGLTDHTYQVLLEDLYDDMSEEVMESLEYISQPENRGYIDYRYCPEEEVSEEQYENWLEHFMRVFDYLQDRKYDI